jgi:hypothetical protein
MIEPTKKQLEEWYIETHGKYWYKDDRVVADELARLAYAAGADAELEGCCEWLADQVVQTSAGSLIPVAHCSASDQLRTARRPKPPSLKQQALKAWARKGCILTDEEVKTISSALESILE